MIHTICFENYNPLNLPQGITLESGVRFNYLYSAAGTKLSEMIYDIDGEEPLLTRDYAGIFEYENTNFARIALASGFITPSTELDGPKDPPGFDPIITPITPITSVTTGSPAQNVGTHPGVSAETATTANAASTTTTADPTTTDSFGSADPTGTQLPQLPGFPGFPTIDRSATYHLYAFDYQGNIVGVYDTKYGTLEQTADYYPYGLPHADPNFIRGNNRRLYSAKELTTEAALNTYDFAARYFNPAFPIFTTPDPLAEDYLPIGPHVFCIGDPINNIDPSGLDVFNINEKGELVSHIPNEEYDEINIVDENGEVLEGQTMRLDYGTLQYTPSSQIESGTSDSNYDCFYVNDPGKLKPIFEFLADGTNVEWTAVQGKNMKKEYLSILMTSHSSSEQIGLTSYINNTNKSGNPAIRFYRIHTHTHSHPGTVAYPSYADIRYAELLLGINHGVPIQFSVYSPSHKTYMQYGINTPNLNQSQLKELKKLCD